MGRPFVIQLENRPGELAHVTRALAMRGVSIQTIAGSTAGPEMCAMLTTDDDAKTREVLRSMGIVFVEGDTLCVEVEDRPGAIAGLTERLAAEGVNITGILVMGRRGTMVQMAFTVDDEAKARAVLGLPPIEALADAC
ncbi:MAG: ACT domain-containing protein [Candidatus Limnocylindrales bacterium]